MRDGGNRNLYSERQVCKGSGTDTQSSESVGFMMQLYTQMKLYGNDDTSLPHLSSLFSPQATEASGNQVTAAAEILSSAGELKLSKSERRARRLHGN